MTAGRQAVSDRFEGRQEAPRWKLDPLGALGSLRDGDVTLEVTARTCALPGCICDVIELTFQARPLPPAIAHVAPDLALLEALDDRAAALCASLRRDRRLRRRFDRVVAERRTDVLREAGAYGLGRGVLLPDTVGLPGRNLKNGSLGALEIEGEALELHLHGCIDPACFCGKLVVTFRSPDTSAPRAQAVLEADDRLELAKGTAPAISREAFEAVLARDDVHELVDRMRREALFARYRASIAELAQREKNRYHPTRRA
jgi:hypothetical protein